MKSTKSTWSKWKVLNVLEVNVKVVLFLLNIVTHCQKQVNSVVCETITLLTV